MTWRLQARAGDALVEGVGPSLLRIVGLSTGLAAFLFAGIALAPYTDTGSLLTVAGGLGALAFGIGQVYVGLEAQRAAILSVAARARIARRSLIEMSEQSLKVIIPYWIGRIGTAAALDPVQTTLRELVDRASPLGGWRSVAAERALSAFLYAADYINPLHAKLPAIEGSVEDVASKGRILGGLIAASDALDELAPPTSTERRLSQAVRNNATTIEGFFGAVLDEPAV